MALPEIRSVFVKEGAVLPSAALTDTLSDGASEAQVVTGGVNTHLTITLTGDTWVATVGADNAITDALIFGIASDQVEATGWNQIVRSSYNGGTYTDGTLVHGDVTRTSDTVLDIELPASASYDITANETIRVVIPETALTTSNSSIVASSSFVITSTPTASAALTGNLSDNATEAEIVAGAGGGDLTITLTGDTWDATVGADNAITDALIAGMTSAGAEAGGWNAKVRDIALDFTQITRTSATVVDVDLGPVTDYAIAASETITVTIPASALVTSGSPVIADSTFDITPIATSVALTGTLGDGALESQIVTGGAPNTTLLVTLTSDTWVATMGANNAITDAFIAGLTSAQVEATGWNAVVRDTNLTFANVTRTSDTLVTVVLPASPTYAITANETITATIPATALSISSIAVVATPTFVITNETPAPADPGELPSQFGGAGHPLFIMAILR